MTDPNTFEPYVKFEPGGLIAAEDQNALQQRVRAEIAANAEADAKDSQELRGLIANVDAPKFGGKTPEEWNTQNDRRYIRRDEPQAAGQFRRYFKQLDRRLSAGEGSVIEPAVIEHKLCLFPVAQVYELMPLFTAAPPGEPSEAFDPLTVKFLVYYAAKRDPLSQLLRTEASDWFFWGDKFTFWLDQFGLRPARTQKLDDLLNDFWGKMFDPGLEQDEFTRESFGHTPYVQKWIDDDKSVDDLIKGGQWDDLRVATRPRLLSTDQDVQVFHISQNAIEIQVPQAKDLMVLLRT
jgi:hypothetical protein